MAPPTRRGCCGRRRPAPAALALAALFLSGVCPGSASFLGGGGDHKYQQGEKVPLYANIVGPFHNPSEKYEYFHLPWCTPSTPEYKVAELGEVLEGDRLVDLKYGVEFKVEVQDAKLCSKNLTVDEVRKFRQAVRDDYYFQMFFDNLPIWGFIGRSDYGSLQHSSRSRLGHVDPLQDLSPEEGAKVSYLLFTHVHLEIQHNEDHVIEINLNTDPMQTVDITDDKETKVEFSFSVHWSETGTPFKQRWDKYTRYSFLPQHTEVHLMSIVNSFVVVLLLAGFLATALRRAVSNDFVKYTPEEGAVVEPLLPNQGEKGTCWKYIHGDVFRSPPNPALFCAVIGVGTQLLVLVLLFFALGLFGAIPPYSRGSPYVAAVALYLLTAALSGFVSASLYKQMGGDSWACNVALTVVLFCGPFLAIFAFINSVAAAYGVAQALPLGTLVPVSSASGLIIGAITVLGAVLGSRSNNKFCAPLRTSLFPRDISPRPWYRCAAPQMCIAGSLPFFVIFMELYYVFATVWGHKVYTIYGILLIHFLLLLLVTALTTIALTYFQLASEDHEWWWRSVFCGGSTSLFTCGYSVLYYYFRSDMTGFLQASSFFGYMAAACYGAFLMLGSVGFSATLAFVRVMASGGFGNYSLGKVLEGNFGSHLGC